MKTKDDKFTADMFGKVRGRPRKPNAMTVAQRVRKHRAKKRISVTCNENSDDAAANDPVAVRLILKGTR